MGNKGPKHINTDKKFTLETPEVVLQFFIFLNYFSNAMIDKRVVFKV